MERSTGKSHCATTKAPSEKAMEAQWIENLEEAIGKLIRRNLKVTAGRHRKPQLENPSTKGLENTA